VKTRMLIMRPDESHETRELDLPTVTYEDGLTGIGYDTLKALLVPIVGDPIEHVTVLADFAGGLDFRRADMFVNELGHVVDPPLPRNEAATDIYRRNALMYHGYDDPEELPWIAGPAVLFEKIVWV
jgi:hypothetical protein